MAFTDRKAGLDYINQYQKEKYDRITIMASKGKKAKYQEAAKSKGAFSVILSFLAIFQVFQCAFLIFHVF